MSLHTAVQETVGNMEQLGTWNSWEHGTFGNMEQLGTRNRWEHGTVGNMEQVGLDIYCSGTVGRNTMTTSKGGTPSRMKYELKIGPGK
jgi:hypothetical protein